MALPYMCGVNNYYGIKDDIKAERDSHMHTVEKVSM